MLRQISLCTAVVVMLPLAAGAQPAVATTRNVVTATATIEAIDQTARTITLEDSEGEVDTVYAGPEVKRFSELEVGDTVTLRYYESVVYQIRKPGAPAAPKPSDESALTPGTGKSPGGTLARQLTASVTVMAIDPSVPSITVRTSGGHTVTRKVQDARHLAGIAVGDRIDITYTMALLMGVEPAKPATPAKAQKPGR